MKPKKDFRLFLGREPSRSRRVALTGRLFLLVLFLAPAVAQEPGGKPDAPTPKTGQTAIPLPSKARVFPPPAKSAPEPDTLPDFEELAARLSEFAAVANCQQTSCTILVTDFVLPDGNTSLYGTRLADELSRELVSRTTKMRAIDRLRFHEHITKDRVPVKSINEQLARAFAADLQATFVVLGTTHKTDDGAVQLLARLLYVPAKQWGEHDAQVKLPAPNAISDLSPSELLTPLPPILATASGEKVYPPGVDGLTTPTCYYMPNPPFSEEARRSKVSGSLTAEAVINSEGRLENARIVRGLPYGLNETTIATMKTWKCNPAQKDGKPVPTIVQFEVHFRLY
ncbi:MAG: energy transducer TonB [Candidatus Acidiferrales bacterium]